MAFRFSSLVYSLPGVLVLLSGWWYLSRRKGCWNKSRLGIQSGENTDCGQARGSGSMSPDLEGTSVDLLASDEELKVEHLARTDPDGHVASGSKSGLFSERSWASVVANSLLAEVPDQHLPSPGVASPSNCLEMQYEDGGSCKAAAYAVREGLMGDSVDYFDACQSCETAKVCDQQTEVLGSDACSIQAVVVSELKMGGLSELSVSHRQRSLQSPLEAKRETLSSNPEGLAGGMTISGCVPCSDTMGLSSEGGFWTQNNSPPVFPPSPQSSDLVEWEVEVPKHLVGLLIGKKGRSVSFMKRNSGAKIYIFSTPLSQDVHICHIEGSMSQVARALQLIGEKFSNLDLTNHIVSPDPALNRPAALITWLTLPEDVAVEVVVVNVVSVGRLFVHQHKHLSHRALRSLEERMYLCYAQRGVPHLLAPVQSGTVCAAPGGEGAWWRAQVSATCEDPAYVEVRYVDYGGYKKVKVESLRQIRSDFVSLPFQGIEVVLDNLAPLPGEKGFSEEATLALEKVTRGVTLLAQVTKHDLSGLPMVLMWKTVGEKMVSVNEMLAEEGFCSWMESA